MSSAVKHDFFVEAVCWTDGAGDGPKEPVAVGSTLSDEGVLARSSTSSSISGLIPSKSISSPEEGEPVGPCTLR